MTYLPAFTGEPREQCVGSGGRDNVSDPQLWVGRRDGVAAGLLQSGEGERSKVASACLLFSNVI